MSLLLEYPNYLGNLGKGQYPWVYPGGEVGVRVPAGTTISKCTAHMHNAQDIIQFIMASRGREEGPFQDVLIPYLPYARQDRVAAPGDPNAINVFADLIRESLVRRVVTLDAHSPEAEKAFLTRGIAFQSISPVTYIKHYLETLRLKKIVLVSPDKGARKKVDEYFNTLRRWYVPVVGILYCDKVRDPDTGKLNGFAAISFCDGNKIWPLDDGDECFVTQSREAFPDADYVILDDICDGGGTFRGIREQVFKPDDRVHLWTTHGIYSGLGGVRNLTTSFNSLGSTDSFHNLEADSVSRDIRNYSYIRVSI